jgi:hypothetical protein
MSKIIAHTANGSEWLIVEVPKVAVEIAISVENILTFICDEDIPIPDWVVLGIDGEVASPNGNYSIHCIAEDATEEQAVEVVEKLGLGYTDDIKRGVQDDDDFQVKMMKQFFNATSIQCFGTALEAVKSIILHHFGVTDSKHVILKKH